MKASHAHAFPYMSVLAGRDFVLEACPHSYEELKKKNPDELAFVHAILCTEAKLVLTAGKATS